MTPVRFMLLMPWGRVGSNLIFAILRQSAKMKLANESLNSIRTAEDQAAWFDAFYEAGSASPSQIFIGSKQNMLAIRDDAALVARLRAAKVRVVRLRRADLVRAAVSQIRAEQYAEKTGTETGERLWAIRKGMTPLGATAIEPELLLKRIAIMEAADARLMQAFDPAEVLDIEYEDVNISLDGVVRRVRDYLDVPQGPYNVPFVKATPDRLEDAIANYDEVLAKLRGTPYARALSPAR
jgi:LPS sulfotransferase NodH